MTQTEALDPTKGITMQHTGPDRDPIMTGRTPGADASMARAYRQAYPHRPVPDPDRVPTADRTDDAIARDMMTRAHQVHTDALAAGLPLGTPIISHHAALRRYAEVPESAGDLRVLHVQLQERGQVDAYAAHWGAAMVTRHATRHAYVHAHAVVRGVAVDAWCRVDAEEVGQ